MDFNTLRITGIAVSGALIAGAIYIAGTAPRASNRAQTAPARAAQQAAPPPQAWALSFRGDGPLARAQRLAMRGGHARAAQAQAERALRRQRAFSGLCFDRFSARGDIVVRPCAAASGTDWAAHLRAVPAVTNVDAAGQLPQDGHGD